MTSQENDPEYQLLVNQLSHGLDGCEKDPEIKAKIKGYADELWKKRMWHKKLQRFLQYVFIGIVVGYLLIMLSGGEYGNRERAIILVMILGFGCVFWGTRK